SKSFSLYGERVGALSIVTESADERARVTSQVKRVIRTNYSNPPTHGGSIVATILASADLRAQWESELAHMRVRIKAMREGLVSRLNERMKSLGIARDFSFIAEQKGMFSYSGLTTQQVHYMREHAGIYAIDSGRICLAAVNDDNIDNVANAMADAIVNA
ncbi:MAG: aminotransferase class I/II-fold pyridoxal phosphate-dependent enzyme, partial [Burkholderiaceae bacterium]